MEWWAWLIVATFSFIGLCVSFILLVGSVSYMRAQKAMRKAITERIANTPMDGGSIGDLMLPGDEDPPASSGGYQ